MSAFKSVPLLHATTFRPLLDFLDRRRGGAQRLFGAELELLREADAVLPYAAAGRVFDVAARACGESELGLIVGESTRPEDIGALGAVARRAPTVCAVLATLQRQGSRFNTGQRFHVVAHGDEIWLSRHHTAALVRGRQQVSDFVLMLLLQLFRVAAGPEWRPLEIRFEGDPPPHAERLAALAPSVSFGNASTVVVLPRALLALPLPPPGADTRAPERPLPSSDPARSLLQMVEALVRLGSAHVEAAAESAGTSVRSFQRRLARAGLRFEDLLQHVRLREALRLLSDPDRKVVEVSAALGYTDSANFTRAFRRWTGLPPQEFRQLAREGAATVTGITGGSSPLASLPIGP